MSAVELTRLQGWFQNAVVRPSLPFAIDPTSLADAERGAADAELHVLPSRTLTPSERVGIYADAYLARLVEVLTSDYAAVSALAGCGAFHELARRYLAAHPSKSFTLSVLGRHFPDWIAGADGIERRELLADIARVELAITRTFDAPRESALRPADMAALPPEVLADPRPRLIAALELLDLRHSANAIVRALRNDGDLPSLDPARTYTLVWRKDDVVWRRDLAPAAFALLDALAGRSSLADAIAAAERAHTGAAADLADLVPRWIGEWSEDGLFAAME